MIKLRKSASNEELLEVKPHIGTFVTPIVLKQISDFLYIREVLEKAITTELIRKYPDYFTV